MKTEITKDRLMEYFHPTERFVRYTDGAVVDQCGSAEGWDEKDWADINNPSEDVYEHIIAYVHFDRGTDNFNKLFIEVTTSFDAEELEVEKLVNEEEKQNIIAVVLKSLHKWRGTENMLK